jgi:imidazole glycerol phosphate synthase subunit HisF
MLVIRGISEDLFMKELTNEFFRHISNGRTPKTLVNLVREVGATINIPFTVGGGISSVADVEVLLQNG